MIFFLVVNYIKLVPYGRLGRFSADNLITSPILAPLAMLGIGLGYACTARPAVPC